MINDVFIIDKGGICLFHKNFESIMTGDNEKRQKDIQLIAGFFSALESFAQEINDKKEYIQSIVLSKSSYFLHSDGKYCAVLQTDSINQYFKTEDYIEILKNTLEDFKICLKTDYINTSANLVIESPELVHKIKYYISQISKKSLLRNLVVNQNNLN